MTEYLIEMKFNKEITGEEPLPRSTNISWLGFNPNLEHWPLAVKFFPYKEGQSESTYIYNLHQHPSVLNGKMTIEGVWDVLTHGWDRPDLYDDPERKSVGSVFNWMIKKTGVPFKKVEIDNE